MPKAGEVRIELFWKGIRDYRYWKGFTRKDLERRAIDAYDRSFSTVRGEVMVFQEFQDLKEDHYTSTNETASRLTPKHFFIGEDKHESTFGADGKLVLVHQLIRQYVTATILLQLAGNYLKKTSQVRFMIKQGWLKDTNVLCPQCAVEVGPLDSCSPTQN